jgi:tripartite-type tricarboxylate transporter receptor subunit TctC
MFESTAVRTSRRFWLRGVAGGLAVLLAGGALAQDYPARPIRIVSPFATGTAGDLLGRVTAQKLAQHLGSSVVLENRPGASGTTGARHVVEAAPDGYTLLLGGGPLVLNQTLDPSIPFKVERDLLPVAAVARTKIIMVTRNRPDAPATLPELLSILRERGESVNYASVGPVTMGRLTTATVLGNAGVKATHVPYKGSSESLVALMRGDVLFASDAVSAVLAQIKAGNLRPLAVASQERLSTLPEVPTFAEAGVPGVDINVWYGMFLPARSPQAVASRLASALGAVVADPEYKAQLAALQFETFHPQGREFEGFIRRELDSWTRFFRTSGIQLEKQ